MSVQRNARPHLLVTRPQPQAQAWVEALQAAGCSAWALPLLSINAEVPGDPLQDAGDLRSLDLVFLVSPNAAASFNAALNARGLSPLDLPRTRVAAPGAGTARVLMASGWPSERVLQPRADAAQMDSEALWSVICHEPWVGRRVLFVQGQSSRPWLGEQFEAAGAQVIRVQLYSRGGPDWTPQARQLLEQALVAPADHVWLLSSSEALQHLLAQWPATADRARSQVLATHPRIAENARMAGFGVVFESMPTVEAVVSCIQSQAYGQRDPHHL